MSDIDKVKGRFALVKAQGEVLQLTFVFYTPVSPHGPGEAAQIGIAFGEYFDILGMLAAFIENGAS